MSEISIEWLEDRVRFDEVGSAWDRLALSYEDPFSSAAWLGAWWKAFAHDTPGGIAVAWRDGVVVGGLPLLRTDGGLSAMANEHSPVFRVFASDASVRQALIEAALESDGGTLLLPAVPADDPLVDQRGRWRSVLSPAAVSPIVDTSGKYDEWRATSKPRWGAPLERFRRKMERERALELVLNEPPVDLDQELKEGFVVEGSGWKGKAGTAITSVPETEDFYRTVAAAFHARGELECSTLRLDGVVAAWDLCLRHGQRVFLLKTGYDEEYRRLAPGLVLRLSVIERCFETDVVAHELLGDVDDWKPKFATSERRHVCWHGYMRSRRGNVAYARRRMRRLAGVAMRRVRSS